MVEINNEFEGTGKEVVGRINGWAGKAKQENGYADLHL
jgi:hypothetical protein